MPEISVRYIQDPREMRAIEELQKEVWGLPDIDVVPVTQLVAATATGGVVIGAFDGDVLAGFAYGFVGYEGGQVTHHSHMLAVKPDHRSRNVGQMLKLAQRDWVCRQGIKRMTWTFDPLQSVNAYFNFNKLGVVADRYFVEFYGGDAASFLHRNGTDRLWVTWLLSSRRVRERLESGPLLADIGNACQLVQVGQDRIPLRRSLGEESVTDKAVIEIPADISRVEKDSRDIASQWRAATREAFTEAINAGYLVDDFHRGDREGQEVGRYVLSRVKTLEDIE